MWFLHGRSTEAHWRCARTGYDDQKSMRDTQAEIGEDEDLTAGVYLVVGERSSE
jgi:hypothetical protein